MRSDELAVRQLGTLWYVTDCTGRLKSQGYRTQTMASLRRDHLERERQSQQQTFIREGEGHD